MGTGFRGRRARGERAGGTKDKPAGAREREVEAFAGGLRTARAADLPQGGGAKVCRVGRLRPWPTTAASNLECLDAVEDEREPRVLNDENTRARLRRREARRERLGQQ